MFTALPSLLRSLLAGALCLAATSALALSNDEFAAQVRKLRNDMAHNDSAVMAAALLCRNLPPHRAAEEPRCVAFRLHIRTLVTREMVEPRPQENSALSGTARCVIGALTGNAA